MKKIYVDYIGFWKGFDKENNFISNILKKNVRLLLAKTRNLFLYLHFTNHLNMQNMIV